MLSILFFSIKEKGEFMEITSAGIIFTIVVGVVYFLPFEKVFDEEGSYLVRGFLYIVSFLIILFLDFFHDVVWEKLSQLSFQNLMIDSIVLGIVFIFTNKENRAVWVLTTVYFALLEAYIKHDSIVGIFLNPKVEDIFIISLYLIMRMDMDEYPYMCLVFWDE